jgi:hypothetical protein
MLQIRIEINADLQQWPESIWPSHLTVQLVFSDLRLIFPSSPQFHEEGGTLAFVVSYCVRKPASKKIDMELYQPSGTGTGYRTL